MERTQPYTGEVAQLLALVQARRRYYRDMLSLIPAAVAMVAGDGSVSFANSAFCRECSLREEDVTCHSIGQILPYEALHQRIQSARHSGVAPRPFFLDAPGRRLRISLIPVIKSIYIGENNTLLLIERSPGVPCYNASELLSNHQIPAILWHADRHSLAFLAVRGAVQELLGFPVERWINTPDFFRARISPEDREATLALYRSAIDRGGEASAEFRGFSDTGEVWVRETIRAVGSVITGVITPLAERRSLDEQRVRDQRTRALRRLALDSASVLGPEASALADHGELLRLLASDSDDLERCLSGINKISRIINELSDLKKRPPGAPGIVNLSRMLKQRHLANSRVSVEVHADQFVLAFADESQLEEVVDAVATSICRDALEGSKLTVACDVHTVTERVPGALEPGTYARLLFHHLGRGLELELQEPLFESLLTSSSPKRATLPALSQAYAMVREWGGDIAFLTEPNAAIFLIYLPHCPSVEWEQEPVARGSESDTGETYQDLVDLLLAEIVMPDSDEGQMTVPEAFDIDPKLFESPLP